MAKGEAKKNNQLVDQNLEKSNQLFDEYGSDVNGAKERAGSLYQNILGQASKIGEESASGYRDLASGGGVSPDLRNNLTGDASSLRKFASTPISGAVKNRVRGNGVYDELTKTGGYSEADKADVLNRAGNAGRSIYDNLRDEVRRNSVSTGGYIPVGAGLSKLAREGSFAANEANQNARIGLGDSIRAGKVTGAQGMSDAERYLQSTEDNRMLQGTTGAASITGNLAGMEQSGRIAGLAGLGGIDASRINALTGLYGTAPGEVDMYNKLRLGSLGQNSNDVSQRINNNPNKSIWDRLTSLTGAVAPIGAAFIGGK